jgi:transcriptional regulator with XRE-family HTH domain
MGDAAALMERNLGDRLREARSLAGISGRRLDALAELRAGHVASIEAGRRPNIEAKTAMSLARVLGVTLDWLLTGVGDEPTELSVRRAVEASPEPTDSSS